MIDLKRLIVPTADKKLPFLDSRLKARFFKRNRKRLVRYGLIAGNLAIVLIAVFFVVRNSGGNAANYSALSTAEEARVTDPLDKLSAADIAANIALMTEAPEMEAILSHSNVVWAELSAITTSEHSGVTVLPQVLSGEVKTKEDIVTYTVKDGDNMESLAAKFGVTSNSIKWSNGLSSSYLTTGKKLIIPPVNGIAYKVKQGDTPKSLADKYNASEAAIIRFNDAEVEGLKVGEIIVIPDGEIRAVATRFATSLSYRPAFSRNVTFLGRYTSYSGVGWYARGWCTDWASYRSAQLGNPVGNWGNANRWDNNARSAGYYVGSVPRVGAVLQTDYGWAGHVGVVEEVKQEGGRYYIKFSDMNGLAGWGNAARTNDWVLAAGYNYIYR